MQSNQGNRDFSWSYSDDDDHTHHGRDTEYDRLGGYGDEFDPGVDDHDFSFDHDRYYNDALSSPIRHGLVDQDLNAVGRGQLTHERSWDTGDEASSVAGGGIGNKIWHRREQKHTDPEAQARKQRKREKKAARERERELERELAIEREREMFDPIVHHPHESRDSTNSVSHLLALNSGTRATREPEEVSDEYDEDEHHYHSGVGDDYDDLESYDGHAAEGVPHNQSYDPKRLPKPVPLFSDVGDRGDEYDEFGFYTGGAHVESPENHDNYSSKTPQVHLDAPAPTPLTPRQGNRVRIVSGRQLEEANNPGATVRLRGGGDSSGDASGLGYGSSKEGTWDDGSMDRTEPVQKRPFWKMKRWIALIILIILLIIIIPIAVVFSKKNHNSSSTSSSSGANTNRPAPNRPFKIKSPYNSNLDALDPNSIPVFSSFPFSCLE